MVGILVSFWDGLFLGAMLVLGSVWDKYGKLTIIGSPIILGKLQRPNPRQLVTLNGGLVRESSRKNISLSQV